MTEALKPICEEWAGVELIPTSTYGVRVCLTLTLILTNPDTNPNSNLPKHTPNPYPNPSLNETLSIHITTSLQGPLQGRLQVFVLAPAPAEYNGTLIRGSISKLSNRYQPRHQISRAATTPFCFSDYMKTSVDLLSNFLPKCSKAILTLTPTPTPTLTLPLPHSSPKPNPNPNHPTGLS